MINILGLAAFSVFCWYMLKLIRFMFRISWWAWRMFRTGKLGPPPQGRLGYLPERVVLSEAESIERGITGLGHHGGGLDSMHPL